MTPACTECYQYVVSTKQDDEETEEGDAKRVSVRVALSLLDWFDSLAARMPVERGGRPATRADVVRMAMVQGFELLEARYPAKTNS